MEDLYIIDKDVICMEDDGFTFPKSPLPIDALEEWLRMHFDLFYGNGGDGDGFEVSTSPEFLTPSGKVIRQVILEDGEGLILYTLVRAVKDESSLEV